MEGEHIQVDPFGKKTRVDSIYLGDGIERKRDLT